MTTDELIELFEKHDDEFLKFDRIKSKRSQRRDLHAFLLLNELVPGTSAIVAYAEHDEIFLAVELGDLAPVATEGEVIELRRCGVRLDDHAEGLAMFV